MLTDQTSEGRRNRQLKLGLAIVSVAVIAVSSLVIYQNVALNPAGSKISWQRSVENFATGLASDNGKVFTIDIWGTVNCYDSQTSQPVWKGDNVGGYFSKGLIVTNGRVYGGTQMAMIGCLDESTGEF